MESISEKHKKLEISGWHRFRQWLGTIGTTSQREASGTASKGGGEGQAKHVPANSGESDGIDANKILMDAFMERREAAVHEAGHPEGRVVPALILGEQRYPDPSMWGPSTGKPLTEDEDYGRAMELDGRLVELAKSLDSHD
ncbi:MAG TPA: hypothetical protein VFH99_01905 [Candidatus Saccharimonadales bacterium]|nr:hypothetical protein [Candidatus Saccharimonadales bacterium]